MPSSPFVLNDFNPLCRSELFDSVPLESFNTKLNSPAPTHGLQFLSELKDLTVELSYDFGSFSEITFFVMGCIDFVALCIFVSAPPSTSVSTVAGTSGVWRPSSGLCRWFLCIICVSKWLGEVSFKKLQSWHHLQLWCRTCQSHQRQLLNHQALDSWNTSTFVSSRVHQIRWLDILVVSVELSGIKPCLGW